jgi:glycosyltransferase involved in cell wall biosynthesis
MQQTEYKPTVSVIIPTYNRAHLIGRAIQSVLDQTYPDFEIIVVDDASTDNTKEVISEFQNGDERIRYIRLDNNKGGAAARNTGINAAQGVYIAFQDSDDEWFPDKLRKQMTLFTTAPKEVGVVYTGFWRIENGNKIYIPWSWVIKKNGNVHKELLNGNFITTQSIVTRKECLEKAGMFDESLPRLQDWELAIRLSLYYHFMCIDEPLVNSFYSIESISANDKALVKAMKIVLLKHFDKFARDKKPLSKIYLNIGKIMSLNGDFINGKYYLMKAIKVNPLSVKNILIMILSLLGQNVFNKLILNYQNWKLNGAYIRH